MLQELSFLEILKSQEERKKKAEELRQQCYKEIELIDREYKAILDEYRPAREEMQRTVEGFNKVWKPKISEYEKR